MGGDGLIYEAGAQAVGGGASGGAGTLSMEGGDVVSRAGTSLVQGGDVLGLRGCTDIRTSTITSALLSERPGT